MPSYPLVELVVGLAFGLTIGASFFGVLVATVRRLPTSRHPGLLVGGSLLMRLALVAAGAVALLAMSGSVTTGVAYLVGLVGARHAVISQVRGGRPWT